MIENSPDPILFGKPTAPTCTESWWVDHPREGFTAEAERRSFDMSRRVTGKLLHEGLFHV